MRKIVSWLLSLQVSHARWIVRKRAKGSIGLSASTRSRDGLFPARLGSRRFLLRDKSRSSIGDGECIARPDRGCAISDCYKLILMSRRAIGSSDKAAAAASAISARRRLALL